MLYKLKPNSKIEVLPIKKITDCDEEYFEAILRIDERDEFVGRGKSARLAKKGAFKRAILSFQKDTSNSQETNLFSSSQRYIFF